MQDIPFIIVFGNTDVTVLQQAKDAGADAYIIKPMKIYELLALISEFLT